MQLRLTQRTPHEKRVREFIQEQDAPSRTEMDAVAHAVGLGVRSLRRRLVAEGTSYQAVASDALSKLAKRHLLVEQRTIQETAYAMGYADSRVSSRVQALDRDEPERRRTQDR